MSSACVGVRSGRQNSFVSVKTFALDAVMTAAVQLTERGVGDLEGEEGGRAVKEKEWSI